MERLLITNKTMILEIQPQIKTIESSSDRYIRDRDLAFNLKNGNPTKCMGETPIDPQGAKP